MHHSSRSLQHFFRSLQFAGSRAYAHAPQQGDIQWRVDPTVKVAAGRKDAAVPLQSPQVFRTHTELAARLGYVAERCCNPGTIHIWHATMCPMSTLQVDTDDALRRWVAKREGVADVSESTWQMLEEEYWIDEWRTADPELRDKVRNRILARYRRLKRFAHEMGGSVTDMSGDGQQHDPTLVRADFPAGDPAALRAEALCLYWAKLAEAEKGVRRFRKDVLGGAAVSESVARGLIHSPAASVLSLESFKRNQIPIVGHTAEFLRYEKANPFERPYWARAVLRITWPGGETVTNPRMEGPAPMETLAFWDGQKLVPIAPWRFSLLRRLHEVAADLCRHYPWEPQDAAWLILTGEAPWAPPLTARVTGPDQIRNHGTITITAAHWVPKDAVTKFYAEVKSRVDSAPTPSLRRLAVFRFVAEQSSGITERFVYGLNIPSWRSLQARWNEEYPPEHEWHYRDVRNFRRDYTEASKSLTGY